MLQKALKQVMQKDRKHYNTQKNYYKVKSVEECPGELCIEVFFILTKKTQNYYIKLDDIEMPEGNYKPDGNLLYLLGNDNTVHFLYYDYEGDVNHLIVDLELYIDAILEEERYVRDNMQYTQEEFN